MIDEGRIRAAMEARGLAAHLEVRPITGSTNDDAKRAAASGTPAPALFVADEQTKGRGRGGHGWLSRRGEGVLLSVLLRPDLPAASSAPLTLAVGVGIAEAIERRAGRAVGMKWPNDLHLGGRKIAGILVEAQTRGENLASVIVGVGLNVHAKTLPPEIAGIATSLAMEGIALGDRSELIVEMAVEIVSSTATFAREGLAGFLDRIRTRDVLRGEALSVGDVCGRGDGIDAGGQLLIRTESGDIVPVSSGSVTWPRTE